MNEVEGAKDLSRSFSSRAEAISAARDFAQQHGSVHSIEEATPSGVITDGGTPTDDVPIVGNRPPRSDGLPETTDEDGLPLDNASG